MHVFKVKNVAILKMFLILLFSWLVYLSVEGTKCEVNKECNLYCSKSATIKVASTTCKILNDVSLIYTNIDEIPKLKPFSIKILILQSNDIQHISRAIKELKIERLYLNDNAITELKTGMFEEKKSFKTVSLGNNEIKVLQRKSIPKAYFLYLNNNLIELLNTDMFINISYVQFLHLNNNRLKKITASSLMGLKANSLVLNHNLLEDLEDRSMPEVNTLFMNNNKLTSINSKMFVNISHLSVLDLSYNRITDITNCKFENSNMIILKLNYNKISNIAKTSFEGMNMLKYLLLTNNLISSLEINSIPKVKNLNLSYNLLTSMEANMFSDVYYLESLDITYNCIKETDLKLMEKVLILNRKFNKKCMLNSNRIAEMDTFWILNSAIFVILVITAIVITVYTRRCTKFSKHLTNLDTPDTPNAQLSYDRVTNADYIRNDGGYVEATNEYEVVDPVTNPVSNINDGGYVEASNEYEVVPVTNSVSNINDGEYVEATNGYEEINDIAVQRESYGYLVPRSAS